MAAGSAPPPAYVPTGEIGVKVYPFRVECPEAVFDFECSQPLPGVTVRRVPDGDLKEFQFIWDNWIAIQGLGLAEKWLRPNMVVVVDGRRYVPGVLERTKSWWPNKNIEEAARRNPMLSENRFLVANYPVHRHLLLCILLLKACVLDFLTDGFVWDQDADGDWRGGSFGVILPAKNFSRDIVAALHRDNHTLLGAPELVDLMQRTEVYYAPMFWVHDRISVALGAYWNFLTAPTYEAALLSLVTVIEALVGSRRTEMTYQICERVACVEGTDLESRVRIYSKVKLIYDHRSKLVHGDIHPKKGPIGWNQPFLNAKISTVDARVFHDLVAIASRLLLKLIRTQQYVQVVRDGKLEEFNNYFLKVVLS